MLYLKKLYTSWYSCILYINTVIVGDCYLVSHLADQTPAPSQRLFNLLRTWSDVSTFLHRGVLIVTASSHVIRWLCGTTRKARNSETMKHIFAGTVHIQLNNCAILCVYIYYSIYIYMLYIYLHIQMQDWRLMGLCCPRNALVLSQTTLDAAHAPGAGDLSFIQVVGFA